MKASSVYVVIALSILLFAGLVSCLSPKPTTPISSSTTSLSTPNSTLSLVIRPPASLWILPLPSIMDKPRLLTQDEKDRIIKAADKATQLVEVLKQPDRSILRKDIYGWLLYRGDVNSADVVLHSYLEQGLIPEGDYPKGQWYPVVYYRFQQNNTDFLYGMKFGVDLTTNKVVLFDTVFVVKMITPPARWESPLPQGLEKPRVLTQAEKDLVLTIAGNSSLMLEATVGMLKKIEQTKLYWYGYTENANLQILNSDVETGITPTGGFPKAHWYPGVSYVFTIQAPLIGMDIGVDLSTKTVVYVNVISHPVLPERGP